MIRETAHKMKCKLISVCICLVTKVIIILAGLGISQAKQEGSGRCWHSGAETGVIKSLSSEFIIRLIDGRKLRLANIEFAETVDYKKLNKWLRGKAIQFFKSGRIRDRHNNYLVQAFILKNESNYWLQAHFISNGTALASAKPSQRACFKALLKLEREARRKASGFWKKGSEFKILNSLDLKALNQQIQASYQIIEGTVIDTGVFGRYIYLNFGKDWNLDFTVIIERRLLKKKHLNWPNLKSLNNKKIRVRGWIDHRRGPMIQVETPEMIEFVSR